MRAMFFRGSLSGACLGAALYSLIGWPAVLGIASACTILIVWDWFATRRAIKELERIQKLIEWEAEHGSPPRML